MKILKSIAVLAICGSVAVSCGNGAGSKTASPAPVFDGDETTSTEHFLSDIDELAAGYLTAARDETEITLVQDNTSEDGVHTIYALPCKKVCSAMIGVAEKDGIILEASFVRGCPGNSIGIGKLVKGMSVDDAISRLEGIDCSERGTSCPDQLAKVLRLLQ